MSKKCGVFLSLFFCFFSFHCSLFTYNLPLTTFHLPNLFSLDSDEAMIGAYSDPGRVWGNGVERLVEEAYRLCFRTRILGGKVMNLRMPFAQNNERDILTETAWGFFEGGKGDPLFLWERIDEILDSPDFAAYTRALSDEREKVIIFDLPGQSWTVSRDHFLIARMKSDSYQGLPHRPHVLVSGKGMEDTDVYNYLYCVGLVGMDCSGFVWHILSYVAAQRGINLGEALRRDLRAGPRDNPAWYAGTAFFNSQSAQLISVSDEIQNLQPLDIMLFRGRDGNMAHAAIIQSVDFSNGIIRYLQNTDEAPQTERGAHDSFIYFDPRRPHAGLNDPSLRWTQRRHAPFPGERQSAFSDDGERYRAFPELGGGKVVRLRILSP